jgi:hypothetical protein
MTIKENHKRWREKHPDRIKAAYEKYQITHKEHIKKYREDHKEYAKQYKHNLYLLNRDKEREKRRQYYQQHKEETKQRTKQYYLANKEERDAKMKYYRAINSEKIKDRRRNNPLKHEQNKRYYLKYKDILKPYHREYRKKRKQLDIDFRIACNLRSMVSSSIRGSRKYNHVEELLGCTIKEFREYLASKFDDLMSWDNYGLGDDKWNADHIIPRAYFDLTDVKQQKQCFHYTNYQPLWEPKNKEKSSWYKGVRYNKNVKGISIDKVPRCTIFPSQIQTA